MKTIAAVLLICGALLMSPARAQDIDTEQLQRAILIALVTDDDVAKARLGARNIGTFHPTDEQLTDLVAERLLQLTATEPSGKALTTVVWQVRVLGELQNPRYRDTLAQVRERTRDEDLHDAIADALIKIGTKEGAPYVPGTADPVLDRAAALEILRLNRKANRSAFGTLKVGASLDEILKSLGVPDELTVWRVRTEKLAIHYRNAGFFLLSVEQAESPRYIAVEAVPEMIAVNASYNGPNVGAAQILGSSRGKPLVQYLKSDRRRIAADLDAMYILVRRILEVPPERFHRYDEVAFVIALETLSASTEPRAKQWLQMVAAMPGDNGTKDYARRLIERDAKRAAKQVAKELEDEAADDSDEVLEDR